LGRRHSIAGEFVMPFAGAFLTLVGGAREWSRRIRFSVPLSVPEHGEQGAGNE